MTEKWLLTLYVTVTVVSLCVRNIMVVMQTSVWICEIMEQFNWDVQTVHLNSHIGNLNIIISKGDHGLYIETSIHL